jgi:hypothetical protein
VAILVCGVVFMHEPPWGTGRSPPAYPGCAFTALLLAQPLLAWFLAWQWREQLPAVVASAFLGA